MNPAMISDVLTTVGISETFSIMMMMMIVIRARVLCLEPKANAAFGQVSGRPLLCQLFLIWR